MLCALIDNNLVVDIKELSEEEYVEAARHFSNVLDIENEDPRPLIGWGWSGNSYIRNSPPELSWKITRLAFDNRFTNDELAGILMFADQTNAYAYKVRLMLKKQGDATYIDLKLPETIYGTNALVSLGLLTQARCNEIIGIPPVEKELYKG